ncbi:Hypothetical protein A7982_04671 [Minicystis rosea]|nr:Hypothetical protein A7982_04671 [Minicystis rosea]
MFERGPFPETIATTLPAAMISIERPTCETAWEQRVEHARR